MLLFILMSSCHGIFGIIIVDLESLTSVSSKVFGNLLSQALVMTMNLILAVFTGNSKMLILIAGL